MKQATCGGMVGRIAVAVLSVTIGLTALVPMANEVAARPLDPMEFRRGSAGGERLDYTIYHLDSATAEATIGCFR